MKNLNIKSGYVEGFDNISRALKHGIENTKKKIKLILKYSYPTLYIFNMLNFNVIETNSGLRISIDRIPPAPIYYLIRQILLHLFNKILRSELKKLGLRNDSRNKCIL